MNHFDGADGPLRISRINIHQDDFGALVLQLTQQRIARSRWKPDVAQYSSSQMSAFQARVKDDGLFAILGKDGDGDAVHESILSIQDHATNFLCQGQVTFVIEGDLRRVAGWLQVQTPGNLPDC